MITVELPSDFREYTVEDLMDVTYELRVELEDGNLIMMSPANTWHFDCQHRLLNVLRRRYPHVTGEILVELGSDSALSPDIVVLTHSRELEQATYQPGDIALVVELVSPRSRTRDRVTKPVLYAQAGIAEFWRVERIPGTNDDDGTVYQYALEDGVYKQVAETTVSELEKSAG